MRHLHISLVGLLTLSACQPALLRTVGGLSASGDFVQATEVSIRAVSEGDERGAELLQQYASDAYKYEWDRAREAEADGRLEDSLSTYDALLVLGVKVKDAGGPVLDGDVAVERKAIAESTSQMFAARAEVAYEDARWQDALDGWRMAEGTAPGFTEAKTHIPDALERLGDAARTGYRYRDAIKLYDSSVEEGGTDAARAWSAAIHAAIGRHALREGACRKAVNELTAAAALPFDLTLSSDLDKARSCASRQVVVKPFEDLVKGGIDDKTVGVLLVDQVAHQVRTRGSGFIKLIDASSSAAKQRISTPGRRYEVRGHLTRVDVVRSEPTDKATSSAGTLKVPCEPGGEPTCLEEVTVNYTLRSEGLAVTISGNIKVVDVATGEQVATKPLEIRVDKTRSEMHDVKVTDLRGYVLDARLGARATDRQVALKGKARGRITPGPPLPDSARIVDEAIVRIAAVGATAVLAHVDHEAELADPVKMELVTPVVSAGDIHFGDSDIHEHTPEEIEFSDDPPVVEEQAQ